MSKLNINETFLRFRLIVMKELFMSDIFPVVFYNLVYQVVFCVSYMNEAVLNIYYVYGFELFHICSVGDVKLSGSLQKLTRKTRLRKNHTKRTPFSAEESLNNGIPQTLKKDSSTTMQNRKGSAVTWSHVCLYSFSGVILLLEKAARKLFSV